MNSEMANNVYTMTVLEYLTIRTFDIFSLPLVTFLLLFCLVDTVSIVAVFDDDDDDDDDAVGATTVDSVLLISLASFRANNAIVLSTEVSVELSSLAPAAIVAIVVVACW